VLVGQQHLATEVRVASTPLQDLDPVGAGLLTVDAQAYGLQDAKGSPLEPVS